MAVADDSSSAEMLEPQFEFQLVDDQGGWRIWMNGEDVSALCFSVTFTPALLVSVKIRSVNPKTGTRRDPFLTEEGVLATEVLTGRWRRRSNEVTAGGSDDAG